MITTEDITTEQIYQRADETITELGEQLTSLASGIDQAQNELTTLVQEREQRLQTLQQTRAHVASLQTQLNQAEHYARLVKKSPREQEALKTLSTLRKESAE